MTDADALITQAERLATLEYPVYREAEYARAVARHHTALSLAGWKPVDPAMKKALRVWEDAFDVWDDVLKCDDDKSVAAARVIMEAYPEPEKPSAEMIARANMRLQAEHLNDATDNVIYRHILRQAGEVA